MSFNKIYGHENVISFLKNSLKKTVHSYVFSGEKGIGKRTVAYIFAAALVCGEGAFSEKPCGVCHSCRMADANSHPDIITVKSREGIKSISVDDIRDFKNDVYIRPAIASKKIYIIEEANRMTPQAQNAILKILEEPPDYCVMILTTDSKSALLETVLSRSLEVKFHPISLREMERFIRDKLPDHIEKTGLLTSFSEGIPQRAVILAESDVFINLRDTIASKLINALSPDVSGVIPIIEYIIENKEHSELILDIILLWFRDIIALKSGCNENILKNIDKKGLLYNYSEKMSLFSLTEAAEYVIDANRKLKYNANFNLTIHDLILKINELGIRNSQIIT